MSWLGDGKVDDLADRYGEQEFFEDDYDPYYDDPQQEDERW